MVDADLAERMSAMKRPGESDMDFYERRYQERVNHLQFCHEISLSYKHITSTAVKLYTYFGPFETFLGYFPTESAPFSMIAISQLVFRAWLLCQALLVLKLFLKCYFLDHQVSIYVLTSYS